LAIHENIEEEKQVTPIEEQKAIPPEWVKIEAESISDETLTEPESQVEEAPAIPAEEIPEWIKGLGETPEIEETGIEPVETISPEAETPQAEEVPAWLLASELLVDEKEAPALSQENLELTEEALPDWIKETTETGPSNEEPTPMEPAVTKKLPALPSEPTSELASEEAPITEIGEVKPIESQPMESVWIPEGEGPVQPLVEQPIEAEVEAAAKAPEQPVIPSIEAPVAELSILKGARHAINQGQPAQAVEIYAELIKQNLHLEAVIKDIQEALYRFPVDVNLWVTLGDAHLRTDELQDALNAYAKAEDLVR